MRVTLDISEAQSNVILNALELYFRLSMGQFREIDHMFAFKNGIVDNNELRLAALNVVKRVYFPELCGNEYHGIASDKISDDARVACDIYSVLRNSIAWHKNPEGNPMSVAFDEVIQYGTEELPVVKIEEECR